MTISEMQKSIPDLAEYSNQKISALMRQLILEGLVKKVEDKRKSYFSKV
jgi:DNA-binding transcriptional regulator GbsR (MarR family)